MKKICFIIAIVSLFAACSSSNGEKYNVNDKSHVYYKNPMTVGDAKLVGDYLLKNAYFDSTNEKTIQLSVVHDSVNVMFVVDVDKVNKDVGAADAQFMIMGTSLSADVFGAKPLKIVLADAFMKGFREIPIPGTKIEEPKK